MRLVLSKEKELRLVMSISKGEGKYKGVNKGGTAMKKGKLIGKISGIVLVFVVVGAMLGGLPNNIANAATKFDIGDTVEVTANLNVRKGPGTSYPEITDPDYPGYAPKGTIGKILSGPSSANGYIWWKVDFGPGLYSGWSVEDGLKKVPPSPPTLKSPPNNSEIIDDLTPTFEWYSVSDADHYGLYISEPPYGPSHLVYDNDGPIYGASLNLPNGILSYGIKYCWNMRSHNEAGWGGFSDSWYFTVAYTPPPPPTAPTLTDVVGTSNSVLLGWTDNSNNEDGFKVERKEGTSGTYTQIGTTGANVHVYADSGLQFGKVYCYRVRAYNSAGNSGYSSAKCATTLATPILSSPSNGATLNTNTVTLTWNSVAGADGYAIKVSKIGCGGGDIFYGASISCQQQISNLANGVYYWQVQAAATTYPGLSAYSPCRYFTVDVPQLQPPTAYIDSITPNPATQGTDTVSFTGHGTDSDGSVVAWSWRSSRDGQLSTSSSFNKPASALSVGTHTIYFKVMDDDYEWSTEDIRTLTINPVPTPNQRPTASIISISPNPATQGTHTVSFIGDGTDPDGILVDYSWISSQDGQLSTSPSFNKPASALSVGTHTIYFKVMDDDGDWSTEDTRTLTINPAPTPNQPPDPPSELRQYTPFHGHGVKVGGEIGTTIDEDIIMLGGKVTDPDNDRVMLQIEVSKLDEGEVETLETDYFVDSGEEIYKAFFPTSGNYNWRARAIDERGQPSEWVEFGNNDAYESDFDYGYEPHPYGYKFKNKGVEPGTLTGGVGTSFPRFWEEYIIEGDKWNIFRETFDLEGIDERTQIELFKTFGLNEDDAFEGGCCGGMALASAMQYVYPEYIDSHYQDFNNGLGEIGNLIWNLNDPPTEDTDGDGSADWLGSNLDAKPVLRAILSFQISQRGTAKQEAIREAIDNGLVSPTEILDRLSQDLPNIGRPEGKMYYLSIGYTEGTPREAHGHALIPYKVTNNKIYVYDNNHPDGNGDEEIGQQDTAYSQYVEIDRIDNTWTYHMWGNTYWPPESATTSYIRLLSLDTLYNGGQLPRPRGAGGSEGVFYLDGSGNLLLTDSEGRRTGLKDGSLVEEIPGVRPLYTCNALPGEAGEAWRQAYYVTNDTELTTTIGGRKKGHIL